MEEIEIVSANKEDTKDILAIQTQNLINNLDAVDS
jgi:hypothetical protein